MPEFRGRPATAKGPTIRQPSAPPPPGATLEEMKMARWLHDTCRGIVGEDPKQKPWPDFDKIPKDRLEMYVRLGRKLMEADFAEILS